MTSVYALRQNNNSSLSYEPRRWVCRGLVSVSNPYYAIRPLGKNRFGICTAVVHVYSTMYVRADA